MPADDRILWDAWLSTLHMPAVSVAHEIGVFTELSRQPLTCARLAMDLNVSERAIEALSNVLLSVGLLAREGEQLEITETATTYLLEPSPYFWGGILIRARQNQQHIRLLKAVQDSSPLLHGQVSYSSMWREGSLTMEAAVPFTQTMHSHTYGPAVGAVESGCFDDVKRLLDVGAGSGCFSIALAKRNPSAQSTVMDLAPVCELAQGYVGKSGITSGVSYAPLNFFTDEWPADHDGILFSNIFHDWDAKDCTSLASKAFAALPSGGKIFLHEILLEEDGTGPLVAACFSLLMFINHGGGKQYTITELTKILGSAGFTNIEAKKTFGYFSVVSAEKK